MAACPRTPEECLIQWRPPSGERATAMREDALLAPGLSQLTYTSPLGATVCEGNVSLVWRTFWLTGSSTGWPDDRPITIGLLQVRPPSLERIANSCAGPAPAWVPSANTSSSEPSRLTRIVLVAGQLSDVCGSYSLRGADQVRPRLVVVDSR